MAAVLSIGSVLSAWLGLLVVLLARDLLAYDGRCGGGLLPFIGGSEPRPCSFGAYFDGHGLFTLKVVTLTVWPIAALFVLLAVLFGLLRDRPSSR